MKVTIIDPCINDHFNDRRLYEVPNEQEALEGWCPTCQHVVWPDDEHPTIDTSVAMPPALGPGPKGGYGVGWCGASCFIECSASQWSRFEQSSNIKGGD